MLAGFLLKSLDSCFLLITYNIFQLCFNILFVLLFCHVIIIWGEEASWIQFLYLSFVLLCSFYFFSFACLPQIVFGLSFQMCYSSVFLRMSLFFGQMLKSFLSTILLHLGKISWSVIRINFNMPNLDRSSSIIGY